MPVIMLSLIVHVVALFGKFWRDGYLMSLYEEYKTNAYHGDGEDFLNLEAEL